MIAPWAREKALILSAVAQPERDPEVEISVRSVEIHVKPADRNAGRWRFPTTRSV